jgi:hypothetical protein
MDCNSFAKDHRQAWGLALRALHSVPEEQRGTHYEHDLTECVSLFRMWDEVQDIMDSNDNDTITDMEE